MWAWEVLGEAFSSTMSANVSLKKPLQCGKILEERPCFPICASWRLPESGQVYGAGALGTAQLGHRAIAEGNCGTEAIGITVPTLWTGLVAGTGIPAALAGRLVASLSF